MDTSESLADLLSFLSKDAPSLEVRMRAADYFAGLTGTEVGRHFLSSISGPQLSTILADMLEEHSGNLRINALRAIVNLSGEEKACDMLSDTRILTFLIGIIMRQNENQELAEHSSMALSNIAHWGNGAKKIMHYMNNHKDPLFDNLIEKFCMTVSGMHYIGSFLGNITQTKDARIYILNKSNTTFKKLLSFISFKDSIARQRGVVSCIKNCCFEIDCHMWMLGDKVDILPALLLPLAGPEEFEDEEMDKLPLDLQYLKSDKQREPDPEIRKMLVESIAKLCTTKEGRKIVKDQNAYIILREMHKWEKVDNCISALENVISILISDEPQKGMENLNEVIIPDEIEKKLNTFHFNE